MIYILQTFRRSIPFPFLRISRAWIVTEFWKWTQLVTHSRPQCIQHLLCTIIQTNLLYSSSSLGFRSDIFVLTEPGRRTFLCGCTVTRPLSAPNSAKTTAGKQPYCDRSKLEFTVRHLAVSITNYSHYSAVRIFNWPRTLLLSDTSNLHHRVYKNNGPNPKPVRNIAHPQNISLRQRFHNQGSAEHCWGFRDTQWNKHIHI